MHRPPVLRAFGDEHDRAVLALAAAVADKFLQLVDVGLILRNDGGLGTGGDGGVLSEETGVTAHHLDKEYAVVGCRRVPDLVHTLNDRVKRRIIADRGICPVKIVVNRARQTDDRGIIFVSELLRAGKGAVTTDDDKSIDSEFHQIVIGLLAAFRSHKLLTSGGFQNRTASLDRVAYTFSGQLFQITVDESLVTTVNAEDFPSVVDR